VGLVRSFRASDGFYGQVDEQQSNEGKTKMSKTTNIKGHKLEPDFFPNETEESKDEENPLHDSINERMFSSDRKELIEVDIDGHIEEEKSLAND